MLRCELLKLCLLVRSLQAQLIVVFGVQVLHVLVRLLLERLDLLVQFLVAFGELTKLLPCRVQFILRFVEALLQLMVLFLESSDFVFLLLHEDVETLQLLLARLLQPVDAPLVGLLHLCLHFPKLRFVGLGGLEVVSRQGQELLAVLLGLLFEVFVGVVLLRDHGDFPAVDVAVW